MEKVVKTVEKHDLMVFDLIPMFYINKNTIKFGSV